MTVNICGIPHTVAEKEQILETGQALEYVDCGIGFSHTTCPLEVRK